MRWVSYLSPSGGSRRHGVLDDGCVFGYPGPETVPELLERGHEALAEAHRRALAAPVEIIVEFEARLCAPVLPSEPVPVRLPDGAWGEVAPELVRGVDDGVAAGGAGLSAAIGVAILTTGADRPSACTVACLWRAPAPARSVAALTLGPAIVDSGQVAVEDVMVTASVAEDVVATAGFGGPPERPESRSGKGIVALLPAETGVLEAGEELYLDAAGLGAFEMRVG